MLCNGISLVCGLTFTHFYLVASNLIPNFIIIVTHSIFNIMSSVIPLNKNGTCVEDFVLVKYDIMKYYSAINVS